nr:MAG TPA: hypothetical protein [Bacteriophage sp.]
MIFGLFYFGSPQNCPIFAPLFEKKEGLESWVSG